jgi:D-alanine transaminase
LSGSAGVEGIKHLEVLIVKVLVNGKIINRDEVKVDIEDRGYQFGDGVYEVINIYDGVPFTLKEHIDRFYRSAKEIGITIKNEPSPLISSLLRLIEENNMKSGGLYIQITRGVAPRTHQYDSSIEPRLVAYPLPFKDIKPVQTKGVEAITGEDLRWLRCDIKSLNLLYNVMMKQKANDIGAFETILIRDGFVTEGTSSNIFIVKNGILYTHPANNKILNGITRMKVLQILKVKGWEYKLEAFTKEQLEDADEVFLTSTTSEVLPITKVDEVIYTDGKPGPYTLKFQQAFRELVTADIKNYEKA